MTCGTADERSDARQQLLDLERLWQVVVGAGIDALDPLRPSATRRQDEHRRLAAGGAPAFQNRETVDLRKAEVENDQVELLGLAAEPGSLTIGSNLDRVSGPLERRHDVRSDRRLVLGEENAHHSSSSILRMVAVAASTSTSLSLPSGVMTSNS